MKKSSILLLGKLKILEISINLFDFVKNVSKSKMTPIDCLSKQQKTANRNRDDEKRKNSKENEGSAYAMIER